MSTPRIKLHRKETRIMHEKTLRWLSGCLLGAFLSSSVIPSAAWAQEVSVSGGDDGGVDVFVTGGEDVGDEAPPIEIEVNAKAEPESAGTILESGDAVIESLSIPAPAPETGGPAGEMIEAPPATGSVDDGQSVTDETVTPEVQTTESPINGSQSFSVPDSGENEPIAPPQVSATFGDESVCTSDCPDSSVGSAVLTEPTPLSSTSSTPPVIFGSDDAATPTPSISSDAGILVGVSGSSEDKSESSGTVQLRSTGPGPSSSGTPAASGSEDVGSVPEVTGGEGERAPLAVADETASGGESANGTSFPTFGDNGVAIPVPTSPSVSAGSLDDGSAIPPTADGDTGEIPFPVTAGSGENMPILPVGDSIDETTEAPPVIGGIGESLPGPTISGDEGENAPTATGSGGDRDTREIPPVAGAANGNEILPTAIGSSGETETISPVSGGSGEGENPPTVSGTFSEQQLTPLVVSGSREESATAPPISGGAEGTASEPPLVSGSQGESAALPPPASGSPDDTPLEPAPVSGSGDETDTTIPAVSGGGGETDMSLPPALSGNPGETETITSPVFGGSGEKEPSAPPASGSAGETETSPFPTSGDAGETTTSPIFASGSAGETETTPPPITGGPGETETSSPSVSGDAGETATEPPPVSGGPGETTTSPPVSGGPGEQHEAPPPVSGGFGETVTESPPVSGGPGETTQQPPAGGGGGGEGGGGGGGGFVSSGGGGGFGFFALTLHNPRVTQTCDGVIVEWFTNQSSEGYAVFGTGSVASTSTFTPFGYSFESVSRSVGTTTHRVMLQGVLPGDTYFVRPISVLAGYAPVLGIELSIVIQDLDCGGIGGPVSYCPFISNFIDKNRFNDPVEVQRLQLFLRIKERITTTPINGVFDEATEDAVKIFQERRRGEILDPLGLPLATGNVHAFTIATINDLMGCENFEPVRQRAASSKTMTSRKEGGFKETGKPANDMRLWDETSLKDSSTVFDRSGSTTKRVETTPSDAARELAAVTGALSDKDTCDFSKSENVVVNAVLYLPRLICCMLGIGQ